MNSGSAPSVLGSDDLVILRCLARGGGNASIFAGRGQQPVLAAHIADHCGFAPRSMGSRMRSLYVRGLVSREVVRDAPSIRGSDLYGWKLTDAGESELASIATHANAPQARTVRA
jgi:hypothetical protein